MRLFYINTNPLLDWAEAQTVVADNRCQRIAAEVEGIIEDSNNVNSISEITLAEYQSNLSKWVRDNTKSDFDSSLADQCLERVMRWITNGNIQVLEQPPRLIERAMAYVRFTTREKMRNLRAWDAAHIYQACHWARSMNTIVEIVTSDEGFPAIIEAFPEFQLYIRIYNPDNRTVYP